MVLVTTSEPDSLQCPTEILSENAPLLPKPDTLAVNDDEIVKPAKVYLLFLYTGLVLAGTSIPIIPSLEIYRFVICRSQYANEGSFTLDGALDGRCLADDISKQVANLIGLDGFIVSLAALCTVLGYGRMADIYGRKPPLYIATTAVVFALLWTILVVHKAATWNYNLILLGSIIAGLGGAAPVFRMVLYSIICDCFPGTSRIVAMSYLTATNLMAAMCAPAMGSWFLQRGLLWPLWGGITMTIFGLITLYFIPETHPKIRVETTSPPPVAETSMLTNDENIYVKPENPSSSNFRSVLRAFEEAIGVMKMFGRGRNFVVLGFIAFSYSVNQLAMIVGIQFLTKRLEWSVAVVGYYFAAFIAGKLFILLVLLPLFTTFMRTKMPNHQLDVWLVRSGLLFDALAFLGYGLLSSWRLLPLISTCQVLAVSLSPSLRVLISDLVSADEIGTVYAAFSIVEGIGDLAGLPILSYIYSATLSSYAGLVFIIVSFLYFLGLLASMFLRLDDMIDEEGEPSA